MAVSWFVPHDLKGLIDLMGKEEFNNRLEEGFREIHDPILPAILLTTAISQTCRLPGFSTIPENHGLHSIWVREVLDNYYGTGPVDGYPGDEDQGQMGAWYVMSAMGLFQMDGGASADPVYELSGPIFEKITIQLDQDYYEGKEFIIEARNTSSRNRYIHSASLNGEELDKFWFRHSELVKGG